MEIRVQVKTCEARNRLLKTQHYYLGLKTFNMTTKKKKGKPCLMTTCLFHYIKLIQIFLSKKEKGRLITC